MMKASQEKRSPKFAKRSSVSHRAGYNDAGVQSSRSNVTADRHDDKLAEDSTIESWVRFLSCAVFSDLAGAVPVGTPSAPSLAMRSLCRGLAAVYRGEARGGLNTISLALRQASGFESYIIVDLLLGVHFGRADLRSAKNLLERFTDPPNCLRGVFIGAQAIVEAGDGNYRASVRLLSHALAACNRLDTPAIRLRTLSRVMSAAYNCHRLDDADELAREVVVNAELLGANRIASIGYSYLLALTNYHHRNGDRASLYAAALLQYAEKAGDLSFERYALVGSAWTAFVYGDTAEFNRFHTRLAKRPMPEQWLERSPAIFLDAVRIAADGNFESALQLTADAAACTLFGDMPRALHRAASAVCLIALGQKKDGRDYAKQVLARTKRLDANLALVDRYVADIARLIAVAVLYAIGDAVRARRAVTRTVDPSGRFVQSLGPGGIRIDLVPRWFRGPAEFVNCALAAAEAQTMPAALTDAERELLLLLLKGMTRNAAALELGKSKNTVARQLESIYRKMGVHSRHELMVRAAALGVGAAPPAASRTQNPGQLRPT